MVLFCVSFVSYFGSFVMFVRFLFFLCHHHILQQSVCILRSSSLVESMCLIFCCPFLFPEPCPCDGLVSLHPASVFVSSWCFCSHVLFLLLLFWCLFFFLYLVPNSTSSVLSSVISPSWGLACSLASRYPACILLILRFLGFVHSFHKLSNKAAFYFIPHSRVLPAKMFHDIKM